MLNTKQILVRLMVYCALVSVLAGCGQTGALYLPAQKAAPAADAPAR